ncbi:MAG: hypothetical protein ABI891_15810 [Acidobacteriota bacterium]
MKSKITILTILMLAISNISAGSLRVGKAESQSAARTVSKPENHSQKGQRIQFKKGASSATVSGTIKSDQELIYIFRARAGQTLEIEITDGGTNNDVVFYLVAPDRSRLEMGEEHGEEGSMEYDSLWNGKLLKTGDYKIVVSVIESKKVNFKMSVAIR